MSRLATYDGKRVAPWIKARLRYARRHGWTGHVVSGYRSRALQEQLYREWKSGKRAGPVAVPGTSNHEGRAWPRGAVDVTDAAGLVRAMAGYRGRGHKLRWFGPGDQPHFSATGR